MAILRITSNKLTSLAQQKAISRSIRFQRICLLENIAETMSNNPKYDYSCIFPIQIAIDEIITTNKIDSSIYQFQAPIRDVIDANNAIIKTCYKITDPSNELKSIVDMVYDAVDNWSTNTNF
jgi:hypothetical protein